MFAYQRELRLAADAAVEKLQHMAEVPSWKHFSISFGGVAVYLYIYIEWASARVPPTPITSLEGKDKAVAWPAASLERHRKASSKPTAGGLELVLATAVEGFPGGQTQGQNLL